MTATPPSTPIPATPSSSTRHSKAPGYRATSPSNSPHSNNSIPDANWVPRPYSTADPYGPTVHTTPVGPDSARKENTSNTNSRPAYGLRLSYSSPHRFPILPSTQTPRAQSRTPGSPVSCFRPPAPHSVTARTDRFSHLRTDRSNLSPWFQLPFLNRCRYRLQSLHPRRPELRHHVPRARSTESLRDIPTVL